MNIRHDLRTLVMRPWKNGGGITREIALVPRHSSADDFDWRASVLTIDASGPFSLFPGIERTIVLLAGDGVELTLPALPASHRLDTPLAPYRLDGGLIVEATLIGGSSTDFNIITRRGRCRADVRVVCEAAAIAPSRAGIVHVVAGRWAIVEGDGNSATFDAGQGLAWEDTTPLRSLAPRGATRRCAAIVVAIVPMHDAR